MANSGCVPSYSLPATPRTYCVTGLNLQCDRLAHERFPNGLYREVFIGLRHINGVAGPKFHASSIRMSLMCHAGLVYVPGFTYHRGLLRMGLMYLASLLCVPGLMYRSLMLKA